jgi:hypothetical protein
MKEMESEGLGAVVALLDDNSLTDVFKHRITSESLPTFNANGTFRKCQKSQLVHCMNTKTNSADKILEYTAIIDMGMIIRKAIPNKEQRLNEDGSSLTWENYIDTCTDIIFKRHRNASTIICVNDPYGKEESIKYEERERRSNGQKTPNTHMKLQDQFPSNNEFNKILKSDYNKSRIQGFIKESLARRSRAEGVRVLYSLETCVDLADNSEIPELSCSQAEADTIMLSIYYYLRTSLNDTKPVVIDSEDADVYVQAAYVAHKLPGELKIYRKSEENVFVDCKSLCSNQMAEIIIPLHVMTGCDSNSAFFGHGKKTIFNKVQESEEARNLLKSCGKSINLTKSTTDRLIKFVLKYVYNDSKSQDTTEARVKKWKSYKKRKSLARLAPDRDSLLQHIRRGNYLAYIQLNYSLRCHPSPIDNGWKLINGKCYAERHTDSNLPREIVVAESNDSECSSDESEDELSEDSSFEENDE